jgi:hypothetical protein
MEREPGIRIAGADAMGMRGVERVQAAVLKVGEGLLAKLRDAVVLANTDWRDVRVAAAFADDVTAHRAWLDDVSTGDNRPPPSP